MLNCIVIDDDEVFVELMRVYVVEHNDLNLVGCFTRVDEAIGVLEKESIDLVFLDVEMPITSGLDLLRTASKLPQVILVTAHSKYALEAFEFDVTDYLLKPINKDRFIKSVARAVDVNNFQKFTSKSDHIYFKVDGRQIKVKRNSISLVASYGDYIKLYESENRHVILGTLNRMQEILGDDEFMRIHRKFIINLSAVEEVSGYVVKLSGGKEAQISRSLKVQLVKRLKQH